MVVLSDRGGIMVVLVKDGDRWAAADPRSWGLEADLEKVLAGHPYLIPGCDGAVVATQFAIAGVGVVDMVCVDELGSITLIECKLARNAEIRRAVVGQIFAYASGLANTSEIDFSAQFARCAGASSAVRRCSSRRHMVRRLPTERVPRPVYADVGPRPTWLKQRNTLLTPPHEASSRSSSRTLRSPAHPCKGDPGGCRRLASTT